MTKHTFPLLWNLDLVIGFPTRIKGKLGNKFCNIVKSSLLIMRLLEADLKVLARYSKSPENLSAFKTSRLLQYGSA